MNLEEKIKNFLEKETQQVVETDDADLIKRGILDSFSMIKLINFIETDLGVKIDMEELNPENFNSVIKISEFINQAR